jgi:DNA adenine methylase
MVKKALLRKGVSIVSPLRYPGAKRRLSGYIQRILELNNTRPELFVEPFAGGASISLHLLKCSHVERIGLIDKDPLVAAFWKTVFWDSDWLIEQIETIEISIENWKYFKYSKHATKREKAIGGWGQKSKYKIDCRFTRETLIKRIREAAELKDRVAFVWNMRWEVGIDRIRKNQAKGKFPKDVFFYFDPPFFEKADKLYTHFFHPDDHLNLRDYIANLKDPWVLSYDSGPKVEELYKGFLSGKKDVELFYTSSAQGGGKASQEVLLSNLSILPKETRLWRTKEEWKFKYYM